MFSLKSKSSTEHLRKNDWQSETVFWLHSWEMTRQKRKLSRRHRKLSPPTSRGAENVQRRQRSVSYSSSGCWTHNPLFSLVIRPHYYWLNTLSPLFLGVVCSAENKHVFTVHYKKPQAQKALPSSPLFAPYPSYVYPLEEEDSNYCIGGM